MDDDITHIGHVERATPKKRKRQQERGDLLVYFAGVLKMPVPRMARHLQHLKTVEDLYYLRSLCNQSKNFGATFWTAIKDKELPKPNTTFPA